MTDSPLVGVVGAQALRRDIHHLCDDQASALYSGMKEAGREAAAPVASRTVSSLPVSDVDPRPGRLSRSVRVYATKTGAGVRMGKASVNWAGWVEFGGSRPDGSSREFIKDGRYLFPAARALSDVAAEHYSAALAAVFASSGVWTNTTTDGSAVHD